MDALELTLAEAVEHEGLRLTLRRGAHKIAKGGEGFVYELEISGVGDEKTLTFRGPAWQVEEPAGDRLVVIRGFERDEPDEMARVQLLPLEGRSALDKAAAAELAAAEAKARGLETGSCSAQESSGGGAIVVELNGPGGAPVCRVTLGRYTRSVLDFEEVAGGATEEPPPIIESGPR